MRSSEGVLQSGMYPPPGAEVYFSPAASNDGRGHTGISLGGGRFESVTVSGIQDYSIAAWDANAWGAPYLGWVPAHTPMLAMGTDYFGGGRALVGERGPELVNLPMGSQVIPNHQLGGMGGGIDYDRLAQATAQAVVAALRAEPPVIQMDGQRVSEQVRTRFLTMQKGLTTLGFK